jgi:PleD family two-component response regulator
MIAMSESIKSVSIEIPLGGEIRVLLLDDSKFDGERIRRMCSRMALPIEIFEANSIEQLDLIVEDETFDVIIVDYSLPVVDGFVALEHVNQSVRNHNAGKILITGFEISGMPGQAMRAGYQDFLGKDAIDIVTLERAICNAIGAKLKLSLAAGAAGLVDREVFRQCVIEALLDERVQVSIGSAVRSSSTVVYGGQMDVGSSEDFFLQLPDVDDFLFH